MSQFSYRPTRPSDVARCAELFMQGGSRGTLLDEALLIQLVNEHAFVACVFEELAFDGTAKIWGCGFSAFVRPETAALACRGEIPDLVDTLMYAHRGPAPLLLNRIEQARLNAAGQMHLVMLNFAIDDSPAAPVMEINAVCNKAFLASHSGYGLRTYFMEISDHERKAPMHRQSALAMGCQVAPVREGSTAQVFFLHAEMFNEHPFHTLRMLFMRQPPRLGLSPAQQDQLALALSGCTDEEIAAELGITWNTVRKRWRAIFQRTDQALPGLLGNCPETDSGAVRGVEKRRPLLIFLEEHPEELRPWANPN
ncbi:hypothetical protein [Undibacterium sp.]|jgi:DNA-binding CsgD family transcriptional regulator|uniref:hypothetical protein n=1 Tax=Undibacterium sp. TaxID=1914977 RepID=UPI002C7702C8|nr:hypothetical protein [Undibacterium sp.]HTD02769.1 hypothetical protein [Undibacterium sp.]